jgi:hypothetical protein
MRYIRFLKLFLSIVYREWEPKSCGIPDEYRIHYRMPLGLSWQIAWQINIRR